MIFLEDDDVFEDDSDLAEDEDVFAEDDSDLAERRRRFNRQRGSKARPVRPGQLPTGKGLFKPRPTGQYATQAQLQAGLARVGAEIRKNSAAIKNMATQINKNNADLSTANARQDSEIARLSSDLKKQGEAGKKQNEMMMLMTLLQKQPELEVKNAKQNTGTAEDVVANVQIKKQDNLLPLLLMTSMGGSGGMGGDNSMLLVALALSGKL